jgi:hypothetical protein
LININNSQMRSRILALSSLFLCFYSYLSQSLDLKWNENLSSDYILTKGDIIKIPLSEYVTIKGAQFTTSDPNHQQFIRQNLWKTTDVDITSNSALLGCTIMLRDKNRLVVVCNNRNLAIIYPDEGNRVDTVAMTTSMIPLGNQKCLDMVIFRDIAYVACWDRTTKGDITVFKVDLVAKTFTTNKCLNTVGGYIRMARLLTTSSQPNVVLAFWNASPTAPTTSASFTRCKLGVTSTETNADFSNAIDVNSVVADTSAMTIRGVSSISGTEVLVTLGSDINNVKNLKFAILSFDVNYQFTKSKFELKTWSAISLGSRFRPNSLAVSVDLLPSEINVSLADLGTLIKLTMTFNKNNPNLFLVNVAQSSIQTLDCGLSLTTDKYLYKIDTQYLDFNNRQHDRQYLEYRQTANDDFFSFAVSMPKERYACSGSADLSFLAISAVAVYRENMVYALSSTRMFGLTLKSESMLIVDTSKLQTGNTSIVISAKMLNYNPGISTLGLHVCEDSTDYAKMDLPSKTFKSFQNDKFEIPVASANFLANDPKFTFNESTVKVYHTQSFTPSLDIDLSGEYKIDAIYSVDYDTFIAVLKSPGQGDKYVSLFANHSANSFVLTKSTQTPPMPPGQTLFRTLKLGSGIFCVIFKSLAGSTAMKLSISCFEDKLNGKTLLKNAPLTNMYEVDDIQMLETPDRTDLFMVGTAFIERTYARRVLHYWVEIGADGIRTASEVKVISTNHPQLESFYPTDLQFDYVADEDATNHIAIKMLRENGMPAVAKFGLSFENHTPILKFLRMIHLDRHDVGFCLALEELIVLNKRGRNIYAQPFAPSSGIPSYSQFQFPLKDYNISDIIQLNCIPEKAMFQVLALTNTTKKLLMTFRGGESKIPSKKSTLCGGGTQFSCFPGVRTSKELHRYCGWLSRR